MGEIAAICQRNGWQFIGKLEPDEPEDICEIEYMLNPSSFKEVPRMRLTRLQTVVKEEPVIGRNAPCPCGSGKKYKHCCMKKQDESPT
ncbi:SEC-C domain-containing protein [bacterium]|nr:SEC-C domain-containing protein [bacterium]